MPRVRQELTWALPPWIFLAWIFKCAHACVLGTGALHPPCMHVGFGSSRARPGATLELGLRSLRAYSGQVRSSCVRTPASGPPRARTYTAAASRRHALAYTSSPCSSAPCDSPAAAPPASCDSLVDGGTRLLRLRQNMAKASRRFWTTPRCLPRGPS
jgi:hypothetical protein